eukprot:365728-Chlamydomonas_euryale.AAC.8
MYIDDVRSTIHQDTARYTFCQQLSAQHMNNMRLPVMSTLCVAAARPPRLCACSTPLHTVVSRSARLLHTLAHCCVKKCALAPHTCTPSCREVHTCSVLLTSNRRARVKTPRPRVRMAWPPAQTLRPAAARAVHRSLPCRGDGVAPHPRSAPRHPAHHLQAAPAARCARAA